MSGMIVARNMDGYDLLFCIFFVIICFAIDIPLSKAVSKLCKGNERAEKIVVLLIVGFLAYALVKLIGPPIVAFGDALFYALFDPLLDLITDAMTALFKAILTAIIDWIF